eukprot:CAMPEP_0117420712 /NCGR_PEP_ID=MMETSP0758-20121206/1986_1 /TAXON_ID=63605 /ORGANISM="Percolomonas cosmopolitus, Strain AE-1 (ATCC 50343)" /LENGTH=108 /DNA_ID=CAMNT_0005202475 /DNA_START=21 /DNA_END=347 /DNA_ORIENTATION=+
MESCWSSDDKETQWILIKLEKKTKVESIEMTFQGGFSPKLMEVWVGDKPKTLEKHKTCYPKDTTAKQTFDITTNEPVRVIKLISTKSYDFYGRIMIYKIAVNEKKEDE